VENSRSGTELASTTFREPITTKKNGKRSKKEAKKILNFLNIQPILPYMSTLSNFQISKKDVAKATGQELFSIEMEI
jgi:hypothetical protein